MNEIFLENKKYFTYGFLSLIFVISLFFVFRIFTEVKDFNTSKIDEATTISVSGYGEVEAVPDIGNISITLRKEAKVLKDAQNMVTELETSVLAFLKEKGIEDKDIKTSGVSFYPKYEYQQDKVICSEFGCPPSYGGKSVIYAYEVTENINIKVRNVDAIGGLVEGLGNLGITELNGPNFTIDDEDVVKAEARALAIQDAKEKAKILARDLGVRLVKIKGFSEGTDYMPYYGARPEAMDMSTAKASLEIPKGQNTITSNVTITYEIK